MNFPALLQRHLPALRFDATEDFWNASSSTMTEYWENKLFRRRDVPTDELLFENPSPNLRHWNLDTLVRGGGQYKDAKGIATDRDYIDPNGDDKEVADGYKRSDEAGRSNFDNWAYGRIMQGSDGKAWLQYWLFYYKNSLGLGPTIHQGDWEMVQYGLDFRLAPDRATYSRHVGEQEKCRWDQVRTEAVPVGGGRTRRAPVAFIAAQSHANYFLPGYYGQDEAYGNGELRVPELSLISTTSPAWVAWLGRWGADSNSSQGPSGGAGPKRDDPTEYHRRARLCTDSNGNPR